MLLSDNISIDFTSQLIWNLLKGKRGAERTEHYDWIMPIDEYLIFSFSLTPLLLMTAFHLLVFNERRIKHRGNGNELTISITNTHCEAGSKTQQTCVKTPHLTESQHQASDSEGKADSQYMQKVIKRGSNRLDGCQGFIHKTTVLFKRYELSCLSRSRRNRRI